MGTLKLELDESELSRRRRAVYRALSAHWPEERIIEALWVWEERFSRGAAFALHDFVRTICSESEARHLRSDILRSLIKCMAMTLKELGPEPWPKMRAARAQAVESGQRAEVAGAVDIKKAPASTVVFEQVLRHFLDALHNDNPQRSVSLRRNLLEKLPAMIEATEFIEIRQWLAQGARLAGRFSEEHSRKIVHVVYVLACEYYGPVSSDKHLLAAVHSAEGLPEARQFPPARLL